ncbi:unnamed protein product [Pylaiella littoralis]
MEYEYQSPTKKVCIDMNFITDKPVLKGDCISSIFEFCRAKERREFFMTSKSAKETYTDRAMEISTKVIVRLFKKRREMWAFPIFENESQEWDKCLPDIFRGRHQQLKAYIDYQCKHIVEITGMKKQFEYSGCVDYTRRLDYNGFEYDMELLLDAKHVSKFMVMYTITNLVRIAGVEELWENEGVWEGIKNVYTTLNGGVK